MEFPIDNDKENILVALKNSAWSHLHCHDENNDMAVEGSIEFSLMNTLKSIGGFSFDIALQTQSKSNPLVSIVVTSFNCRDLISTCLMSLLLQTYSNIEIIVVDDCSTDGTFELAQSFSRIFKNILVFKTDRNAGTYVAKNIGLMRASGEYVTFQDSDDISHRLRIEQQLNVFKSREGVIANSCHYCRIDENTGVLVLNRNARSRNGLISLMICWPRVKEEIGFFDSVRVNADDEFKTRIRMEFGKGAIYEFEDCYYYALKREDGLTGTGHTGNNLGVVEMSAFLAPVRQRYTNSFQSWHKLAQKSQLYIDFPPVSRKFNSPVTIDPFYGIRFSGNTLVINSSVERVSLVDCFPSFVFKFFTSVVVVTGADRSTDDESDFFTIEKDSLTLNVFFVRRQNTVDRSIKEMIDIVGGGAFLLVDSLNEFFALSEYWMRLSLYKMMCSRPFSSLIVSAETGSVYFAADAVDVSRTKFTSNLFSDKRACSIAAIQGGAQLTILRGL